MTMFPRENVLDDIPMGMMFPRDSVHDDILAGRSPGAGPRTVMMSTSDARDSCFGDEPISEPRTIGTGTI
jgi:hypothetical protein